MLVEAARAGVIVITLQEDLGTVAGEAQGRVDMSIAENE